VRRQHTGVRTRTIANSPWSATVLSDAPSDLSIAAQNVAREPTCLVRADQTTGRSGLGVGRRDAGRAAQQLPAVLLAFDVLRCEGADLTGQPRRARRANLESLLAANPACLQLIAQANAQ